MEKKRHLRWDVQFISVENNEPLRMFTDGTKTYVESKHGATFYIKIEIPDKTRYRHSIEYSIDGKDSGWSFEMGKGPTFLEIRGVPCVSNSDIELPFKFTSINFDEGGIDFSNQTSGEDLALGTFTIELYKRIKKGSVLRSKRNLQKEQLEYDKLSLTRWKALENPDTEINPDTVKEDLVPKSLLMNRLTVGFATDGETTESETKVWDDNKKEYVSVPELESLQQIESPKTTITKDNKEKQSVPKYITKYLASKTFVFVSTAFLITKGFLPKPDPQLVITCGDDYQTFSIPKRATAQDMLYMALKHWKLIGYYELHTSERKLVALDTRMRRWQSKHSNSNEPLYLKPLGSSIQCDMIKKPPKKRQKICVDLTSIDE